MHMGLTLGLGGQTYGRPETVTNGTFDTDITGWTEDNATTSVSSGQVTITNTNGAGHIFQGVPTVTGALYRFTVQIVSVSATYALWIGSGAGDINAKRNIVNSDNQTATGVITHTFTATGATTYVSIVGRGAPPTTVVADNVSIKRI